MSLTTDHLRRCVDTLQASLTFWERAEPGSVEQEVFRNAIIKGYELTQETSFKPLNKVLRNFGYGASKLDSSSVKELLRMAATHNLMTLDEVERWFSYRDNRNNTAHDYGEGFAHITLSLMPDFLLDVATLEENLRKQIRQAEE